MKVGTARNEPTIPLGIADLLDVMQGENSDEEDGKGEQDEDDGTTDKAATPAERIHTPKELERNLETLRHQLMLTERDSDANRNVEESGANASTIKPGKV